MRVNQKLISRTVNHWGESRFHRRFPGCVRFIADVSLASPSLSQYTLIRASLIPIRSLEDEGEEAAFTPSDPGIAILWQKHLLSFYQHLLIFSSSSPSLILIQSFRLLFSPIPLILTHIHSIGIMAATDAVGMDGTLLIAGLRVAEK
jgi:hypothetical protein